MMCFSFTLHYSLQHLKKNKMAKYILVVFVVFLSTFSPIHLEDGHAVNIVDVMGMLKEIKNEIHTVKATMATDKEEIMKNMDIILLKIIY